MKILLAIAMSLLLVACGGSGGGSTDPAPAVNDEPMADSSDDSAQNPEPNSPTESPGPTDPTQNPEPTPDPTPEPSSEMGSDSGPVSNLPSVAAIAIEPGQTQMIMAAGAPAPALEGEPLTTIESARLANNGWVAAWGAVDLSDEVIWKGQYGALAAVLQSGDTIEGFPANAPFESVLDASLLNDGSLWALVRLGGAGQNRSAIIKVSPDGVVTGQLRIGDLAQGSLGSAPVSDVTGLLGGGGKIFASLALGDTAVYLAELSDNGVQLITGSQFDLATLHAPTVANGCIVEFFDFLIGETAYVNEQGAIAFPASLFSESGIACPFASAIVYQNGVHSVRFDENSSFGADVDRVSQTASLLGFSEDGSVYALIDSFNFDTNADTRALWAVDSAGTQELVILSGETLPPDFQQTVAFDFLDTFSFNSGRTLDSASGGQLAIIAQNINGGALLKGTSRPFPYTDLSSPGASQLEQIVNANQSTVPGLDESSFFSEIDDVQITNNNVVWFRGIAENSAGQVNDHSGIWNAVPGSVAVPVINYSIEFSVDAQRVSLTDIDSYFVNEQGDVLVRGEFLDPEDSDFFRRQVLIYQRGAF